MILFEILHSFLCISLWTPLLNFFQSSRIFASCTCLLTFQVPQSVKVFQPQGFARTHWRLGSYLYCQLKYFTKSAQVGSPAFVEKPDPTKSTSVLFCTDSLRSNGMFI